MDAMSVAQELNKYLMPSSFPLGIRILEDSGGLPANVKKPVRSMKMKLTVCQVITLARRYGWVMAVDREEQKCPLGSIILGFERPGRYYLDGSLAQETYVSSREAGMRSEVAMKRLEHNKDRCVLIGPLDRIDFDPDIVLVYGHPAQMMRLMQADLYEQGGGFSSLMNGRGACAEEIAAPYLTGQCQLAMPCTGERIFAQTQDYEMAFSIPAALVPRVLTGLKETHQKGVMYPVTSFLRYEAVFPRGYYQVEKEFGENND